MSMNVEMKTAELLGILQANRAKHRGVFEQACEGYRKRAIAELESALQDARAGRRIRRHIQLVEPEDHTKDYDRAIRMMELEVNETVELGENQFAMFVMDEWSWMGSFTASNAPYTTPES